MLLRYLADRAFRIRVLRDERPFNYAELNNTAATEVHGSVICLLNDDVEIDHRKLAGGNGQSAAPTRSRNRGSQVVFR